MIYSVIEDINGPHRQIYNCSNGKSQIDRTQVLFGRNWSKCDFIHFFSCNRYLSLIQVTLGKINEHSLPIKRHPQI